jgi:hypothetical protein
MRRILSSVLRPAVVGLLVCTLASCAGTHSGGTGQRPAAGAAVPTREQSRVSGATAAGAPSVPSAAPGIGSFGHEAVGGERAAISRALLGYTRALAGANGIAACRHLAVPLQAQVAGVGHKPAKSGSGSCARTLTSMYAGRGVR